MTATTVDRAPMAAVDARRAQPHPLAGLGHQLRFVARRDRVRASVWVLSVVGLVLFSTISVLSLYSTPEELLTYAQVAQADAAFKALTGPGYGLDDPTEGAVVMNEVSLYTYVALALMAFFLVVRHTRAEEDTGRAELVRAAPVGRYATLTASCLWVSMIGAVIAVGLFAVLVANGLTATGSAAFGAASLAITVVFAGVGAVTAQLASSGRSANSLAGLVLGASFLLRAVGDMGTEWLTWLSPLGVTQAIRPFADERWWVLVPLGVLAIACFAVAGGLLARRDLGAGFIGQRPGPPHADPRLATPLALAVRLQRGSVLGWMVGVGVSAFSFGLVADQAEALADNDAIAEVFAQSGQGSITDQFLSALMLMIALLTTGFTIASVLRLRSEETVGRADPILATPVGRARWWWSHTVVALVGSLVIVVVGGAGIGAGYALQVGDPGEILALVAAALAFFVAIALVGGFTALMVAVLPRWSTAAWALLVVGVVVGFLAETLKLPQWFQDLSPFEHVPALPAADFDAVPLVILAALTALSLAAGTAAIRRRDIH